MPVPRWRQWLDQTKAEQDGARADRHAEDLRLCTQPAQLDWQGWGVKSVLGSPDDNSITITSCARSVGYVRIDGVADQPHAIYLAKIQIAEHLWGKNFGEHALAELASCAHAEGYTEIRGDTNVLDFGRAPGLMRWYAKQGYDVERLDGPGWIRKPLV